jgi:hypothetical protein
MPQTSGVEFGSGGTGKVCAACGEDVSSKPRTKDSKGRYYCKGCYDKAIADKHAARASMPMPKVPPSATAQRRSATPVAQPVRFSMQGGDDQPNVLEHLLDLEPEHGPPSLISPSCRSTIAAGGTICTVCGYNMKTGESVRPTKVKLQREPGGTVWPMVVGIMSMVFGIGGIVVYGIIFALVVLGVMSEGLDRIGLIGLAVWSLPVWLAIWLTRDGWRVIRRNSDGVKWMRFWALAKLLIFGGFFTLMMAIPVRALDETLSALPALEGKITGADIKTVLLALMVWFLAWPIFVMIFFFVPRILDDVEAWD